jgi:peptide/nickel transport system ATP-binding protein
MKGGRIVEEGDAAQVLRNPQQPYTQALLDAVPSSVPPEHPETAQPEDVLLNVEGLRKTYVKRAGLFKPEQQFQAVKGVSFTIRKGETVGLVGESGSGKSTIGRILAGLIPADAGHASMQEHDLLKAHAFEDKALRRRVQMIFQDPYSSLNPRHRVSTILTAGMIAQGVSREQALRRAKELVNIVRLDEAALERFPHEFSGGQRQRLGFARAIAVNPELIIADEPVSALDVSVQEQVLKLLNELKTELSLSMLFITHDLRVAAQLCERIIVLQHGEIVEQGDAIEVLQSPKHPYTKALIDAMPGRDWK